MQRFDNTCSLAWEGFWQCPRGAKINQQVFLAWLQGDFQFPQAQVELWWC